MSKDDYSISKKDYSIVGRKEDSIVGRQRIVGNIRITVEALSIEESEVLKAFENVGVILDIIERVLRGKGKKK